MGDDAELKAWCQQNQLTEDTCQVLRQEGFSSLKLLSLLTPQEVDKSLKQPRLLPLAQSLALQHAVALLNAGKDASAAEAMETTSPTRATPLAPDFHLGRVTPGSRNSHGQAGSEGSVQGIAAAAAAVAMAVGGPSSSEDFEDVPPEDHYRFLLVGKTGSGKSTTGNSILGAELFDEDVAFDSLTNRNQLKRGIVDGKVIEIMDCPGLFDTRRSHEEVSVDIVKAVACMHPGPHAVLYVIRLGRYTEEEFEVYARLKALFDADVTGYVIVVLTGGDMLEREGRSLEDVLQKVPDSLHKVLEECQHRVVVFNNVAPDKRRYVTALMQTVQHLMTTNGGGFYTCPRYAEVGQGLEEEVEQRLQEMEREQLASKPYVQELKAKADSAEEELQRGRRIFEQREQERELRARQAEERAERELRELAEEMQTRDLNLEQQRAERDRLLERHQREREEWEREAERQREQDKRELEEKERECQEATRKAEDEQRRFLEAKRRVYERKVAQMKEQIAQGQEPPGFLERVLAKIKAALGTITGMLQGIPALLGAESPPSPKESNAERV